jgi:hypothetical protein
MRPNPESIRGARVPLVELDALASMRLHDDIQVAVDDPYAWVSWESSGAAALSRLLSRRKVEVFERRGSYWIPAGSFLPCFDVPSAESFLPLSRVVLPERFQGVECAGDQWRRADARLMPARCPRRATMLRSTLDALDAWANQATTSEIESLTAAWIDSVVLVRGESLPPLGAGDRFWGERLLVPIGREPDPALTEAAWREMLGIGGDELMIWDENAIEIVGLDAFRPMTRAGIRLARKGSA